ncbi:MAG: type IV pilus assembly protein PilP [Polyangiales bacterium]|jgi:type IV pilus assembly protein PilP
MNRWKRNLCILGIAFALTGCDDEVIVGGTAPPPTNAVAPAAVAPAVAASAATPGAADETTEVVALSYVDDDFVELDVRNRDPFRRFVAVAVGADTRSVQRRVIMPSTSIEEMRLIAIIGGIAQPRAMLQDTSGVGFVVKKDDYIGREEILQAGGSDSMPVTLNWQVARIRSASGEVVLTRTDPTAPDRPPLTRVIPLHDEEEMAQRNLALQ